MHRQDLIDYILLAALWGLSFLFMRVAVPEFGPFSLMLLRCLIGAVTLMLIMLWMGKLAELHNNLAVACVTGVINSAIPFVLLGVAALSITTGTLSILNATAPIWGALIGFVWLRERMTLSQVIGLVSGFVGVAILVKSAPRDPGTTQSVVLLAILATLVATFAYGFAANFSKKYLANSNPLATATGSQIGASVALLVPGWYWWPAANPGSGAWLSVILLGVFSTGVAYLLFFRLIKSIGPIRTITVTFAIPVFGMLFGFLLLGEGINLPMLAGAVVVVTGCMLTIKLLVLPGSLQSKR